MGTRLTPTGRRHAATAGAQPRRRWVAPLLVPLLAAGGCYRYTPLDAAPAPGTRVEVTLSDRGRAATGDSLGPAADAVEGTVRQRSDSSLLLAVASVRYLTGRTSTWSGEPLSLRLTSVRSMRERQFSRSRTALVAASAAAAVVAFIATRTIGGNEPNPTDPSRPPGTGDQARYPR